MNYICSKQGKIDKLWGRFIKHLLEDAVEECFGANTPENYEKGVRFVASLGKMGIIPSYEADRIVSQMDEIISQEG